MRKTLLALALLLVAATAEATQKNLPSTYVNTHGCSLGVSPCEIELTDLAINDVITGPSDDVRFVLYNLNVGPTGTSSNQTQIRLRMTEDAVTISSNTFTMPVSTQISIQLSVTRTGLAIGSHAYKFYVTQNTSSAVSYTTSTFGMVAALNVGSTAPVATPVPPTPAPTNTPLAFSTPGKIAIFGTAGNNFQPYTGSTPCTGYVTAISPSGVTTCATPLPTATVFGTATPTRTATPTATATGTPPTPTPTLAPSSGTIDFLSSTGTTALDEATSNSYMAISGIGVTNGSGAFTDIAMPLPVAGKFKKITCHATSAPGATGADGFTIVTNGESVGTDNPRCDLLGSTVDCTDATVSVTFPANESVGYYVSNQGTANAGVKVRCGIQFTPN